MLQRCLTLPVLAALTACASPQGQYPSLAIRPAERASGTMRTPPAEPVMTPLAQPTLDRLSRLTGDAEAAHKAFLSEMASTRSTITAGRGAAIGDDAWARAEAALADVRAARSKTMIPLVDLDRLLVDAGTNGESTGRIATARDAVSALVDAESSVIGGLQGSLGK